MTDNKFGPRIRQVPTLPTMVGYVNPETEETYMKMPPLGSASTEFSWKRRLASKENGRERDSNAESGEKRTCSSSSEGTPFSNQHRANIPDIPVDES